MSVVTLDQVKAWLRATHDEDDALLRDLIDAAEDEALRYLELAALPRAAAKCRDCGPVSGEDPVSDATDVAPIVRNGICVLVQAAYEGGTAAEMDAMRNVAWSMLRPYRCRMGV
ncbi:head-tail connector protein [Dokdonella sp. MW10]|uniref:head-tail connector protein n=1 Tax=Dokdonella sp. MW10 TaxID=2992926 RepID=UPI003F7E50BE